VSILLNVTSSPTRHLLVHARGLTIHRTAVRLRRRDDDEHQQAASPPVVGVQRAFEFSRHQYWVVELEREVAPGCEVWLEMRFEGSMVGRLSGLYRTSYVDSRTRQTRHCTAITREFHWILNVQVLNSQSMDVVV